MLIISLQNETYKIDAYNMYFNTDEDRWELWVTRTNGKTKLIKFGTEKEIAFQKKLLDGAILDGQTLVAI